MTDRTHPLRRADDGQDPRIDVVLTHLDYMREGMDGMRAGLGDLNAKVAIQNGRVYKTEQELGEFRAAEARRTEEARARAGLLDRNIKILGIVVTVVGFVVTVAVKWL